MQLKIYPLKKIFKLTCKISLIFLIFSITSTIIYRFVPVHLTPLMVLRSASALLSDKKIGISHQWVDLKDISKPMQRAVIKAEDYRFYEHNGFDFEAIQKAIEYNKTHKRKIGASTISQQTAKNVFLWPS